MLNSIDFSGLGAAKKAGDKPIIPPIRPSAPGKSTSWLPKWTPLAIAGLGVMAVIGILLTSKGKD